MLTTLMYLWAGASVLFSVLQMETIGQAINTLMPEDKQLKANVRGRPGVMVIIFFAWPIALPVWVLMEYRAKVNPD